MLELFTFSAASFLRVAVPHAGYAQRKEDGKLHFSGLVATIDGKEVGKTANSLLA